MFFSQLCKFYRKYAYESNRNGYSIIDAAKNREERLWIYLLFLVDLHKPIRSHQQLMPKKKKKKFAKTNWPQHIDFAHFCASIQKIKLVDSILVQRKSIEFDTCYKRWRDGEAKSGKRNLFHVWRRKKAQSSQTSYHYFFCTWHSTSFNTFDRLNRMERSYHLEMQTNFIIHIIYKYSSINRLTKTYWKCRIHNHVSG